MKNLARALFISVAFCTPLIASADVVAGVNSNGGWFFGIGSGGSIGSVGVGCGYNTVCVIASQILYLINFVLVPLLFGIAFIVFLYGVFKSYILSHGSSEAVEQGHRLILWGILGFVVMVSLWGLVNVVSNTFGLSGFPAPPLPRSF